MSDAYLNCAAQHFGMWCVHTPWLASAVAAVQSGMWQPQPVAARGGSPTAEPDPYTIIDGGIAIVPMQGQITKGQSSYGGVSSVGTRQALRKAANDPDVKGIMLHIDSPGGTVAGTAELADEVRAIASRKPVRAHGDDLMASAAFWVGSQAQRVTANATGEVGSIGTVAVVEDTSGMADKMGVKVHVVSTGAHKGAFAWGTEVTEEQLAELQARVDDINSFFLKAVSKGRNMSIENVRKAADGRVFSAAKAREMGLIDDVMSMDAAIADFRKELRAVDAEAKRRQTTSALKTRMAEIE